MRFKKQKRHRKTVRFFTACFGFREPFKILCDGTFVHHLLANGIAPADTALMNILGSPVKIFTTRCVVAELKSLGSSYSDSVNAASSLMTARCDHEKRKSAVACIAEVIGEKNTEHFFVATQDAELRKKFQEIPGVPLIYALRNALFLEQPSAVQQEFAKAAEEERSHMTELEFKMLKSKKKRVANGEAKDSSETDEDHILEIQDSRTNVNRGRVDKMDRAQFKRNKAKVRVYLAQWREKESNVILHIQCEYLREHLVLFGFDMTSNALSAHDRSGPNPLSCKKKKKQGNTDTGSEKMRSQIRLQEGDGDTSARNRTRKRKRSKKSKSSTEQIVQ